MLRQVRVFLVLLTLACSLSVVSLGCGGGAQDCNAICNKGADCANASATERNQMMSLCVALCESTKQKCAEIYSCRMSKSCSEQDSCGNCTVDESTTSQ